MVEKRPNRAKPESKNNYFSILYVKGYYFTHLCIKSYCTQTWNILLILIILCRVGTYNCWQRWQRGGEMLGDGGVGERKGKGRSTLSWVGWQHISGTACVQQCSILTGLTGSTHSYVITKKTDPLTKQHVGETSSPNEIVFQHKNGP